jgi:hypothetical protein
MVGLGIRGDVPPVADQPPLVDGVHLRWTTSRARAFPWHGFFLFRRPSRKEDRQTCVAPQGQVRDQTEITLGDGQLTSPVPLIYTSNFPTPGVNGIDLRSRPYVRFDRPIERPMHRLRVRIAFGEARNVRRCIDFSAMPELVNLPLTRDGVELAAIGPRADVARAAVASAKQRGEWPTLVFDGPLEVRLPVPSGVVEIDLVGAGAQITVNGLDAAGQQSAQQNAVVAAGQTQTFRIAGRELSRIRIQQAQGLLRLSRICLAPLGAGQSRIHVEGLDQLPGTDPADAMTVVAQDAVGSLGTVATVELLADRMTGVRVSGGDAALLDICWSELGTAVAGEWQPVPHCPQPLTLPVRHPDYPAWTGAIDPAAAQAAGLSRVRYGPTGTWAGAPFADLHGACVRLVEGGPATPMTAPQRAFPLPAPPDQTTPALSRLHPLDMAMAGSLHPPIAEMLGLAWTDETAPPGALFDYMIVADHVGISDGDPAGVLGYIAQSGFDGGIDAWITLGLQVEPQAPLAAPINPVVYALPGGPMRDAAGVAQNVAGSAGLTWPHGPSSLGWLDPRAPVMHHVYRGECGAGNTPVVPAQARNWLTRNRPLVSAQPSAAPGPPPAPLPTWPPREPGFLDLKLGEGWYAYQLVAVDFFGRFSPKSPYASWWQWAPEPVPRPWYYVGTDIDAQIHPQAVRILDKTRPAAPVGVEAFVLDPDDPIVVKDPPYNAWRAALGVGGAGTVGLRVRWRWSPEQRQRFPRVTEFRLYWSGGSDPPAGWSEPEAWPNRFFVCPFGNNVTVDADGTRRYDMFLPSPGGGGPMVGGVPLAPTLADVIAYAEVSVTAADDEPTTADRWPGVGPFAARPGNESQCAPPQRVFRVWRKKPPPPPPIVDSARIYATPADWHGHSFHTFRWAPQPNLSAHVSRALDEAVFEADWAVQPRPPLDPADPGFPDAATEPIWTAAKKAQVAALINAIAAALPAGPSAAQKAAAKPAALALYRALSDDALRVLANLQGCERVFVQITVKPLAAADAPDQRGPDDTADYVPSAARCAYIDQVDGRATNRLLYRATFVDGAQNRSALGACGTPVRLPDVMPPRAPAITRALGGDRQVTLRWASNREPDLFEYRVYRAWTELDARNPRTMTLLAAIAADPDPAARPATVEWTDNAAPGLRDLWYRVVAIDRTDPDPRGRGGNTSDPSPAIRVRAFDETPPVPPAITLAEWVRVDDVGGLFPYGAPIPPGATRLPAIHVTWAAAGAGTRVLVQVRAASEATFQNASEWLAPDTTSFAYSSSHTFEQVQVQLKVLNDVGHANVLFNPTVIAPP